MIDEGEIRRLRIEREHSLIALSRSPTGVIRSYGILAVLGTIFAIPATHRALGVTLWEVESVIVAMAVFGVPTVIAYRRCGVRSRLFTACVAVESVVYLGGSLFLVYRSGSVLSAFWLWFAGYLVINTMVDYRRVHLPASIVSVLGLVTVHVSNGSYGAATASVVVAASIIAIYEMMSVSRARLEDSEARRLVLERRIERESIGRDLHDGLGAELTAMLWKAREIGASELADSIANAIHELREVVVGIREAPADWAPFAGYLRARVARLCGDQVKLVVELSPELEGSPVLDAKVASHVVRTAMEAVRNAVQHSNAGTVTLRLGPDALEIADDGRGMSSEPPGDGLANLRARARALGSELQIETSGQGTRIRLPFRASPPRASLHRD